MQSSQMTQSPWVDKQAAAAVEVEDNKKMIETENAINGAVCIYSQKLKQRQLWKVGRSLHEEKWLTVSVFDNVKKLICRNDKGKYLFEWNVKTIFIHFTTRKAFILFCLDIKIILPFQLWKVQFCHKVRNV